MTRVRLLNEAAFGWLAAAAFAFAPSAAMADCKTWRLLSKFALIQANGYMVTFDLEDASDGSTTGSAHYYTGHDLHRVNGMVARAWFDGYRLTMHVEWPNAWGIYEGSIDSEGNLAGVTQDANDPGGRGVNPEVYFSARQKFMCAEELGALPPATKPLSRREQKRIILREQGSGILLNQ